MFNPQSQLEIDFLSMVYGIDKRHVSKITINSKLPLSPTILQYITELRKLNEPAIRYSRLKTSGFRILQYSGNTFAYNPQKHIILDLDRLKINVMNKFNDSKQSIGNPLSKLKNTVNSENGTSENREWEVGSKKDWEEESGKQMSY